MWRPKQWRTRFLSQAPDAQSGEWYHIILCSLPPATKLRQGNVFTPVCDSVHGGSSVQRGLCPERSLSGGLCPGVSVQGGLCPDEDLCPGGGLSVQGRFCPAGGSLSRRQAVHLRAGGTHPTGMHSYCSIK